MIMIGGKLKKMNDRGEKEEGGTKGDLKGKKRKRGQRQGVKEAVFIQSSTL